MAQGLKLATSGIAAVAAQAILGDVATGIVAAGSTLAGATLLPAVNNFIGTAAASTGVILPANANLGDSIFVFNGGASTAAVYPPSAAGTINGGSAGAAVNIATLKTGLFIAAAPNVWGANLSE
jgi:hypothetical protein